MSRLLLGPNAVAAALDSRSRLPQAIFVAEGDERSHGAILKRAEQARVSVDAKPRRELDAMAKGERHQGILAVSGEYPYVELEDVLASTPAPLLLVALDQISDPHNLGAIVRSAVAFGADAVITLKDRAAPVTAAAVRASAGTTEHARIARVTNLARSLEMLKEMGFRVVGLAGEGAEPLENMSYGEAGLVVVVGSEGEGLRRLVREKCDALLRIPMTGVAESLNASVAAGLALYVAQGARPPRRDAP